MIQSVLEFAREQTAQGGLVALITVTQTHGSSPASVGQLMAVTPEGKTAGTVGGGASEHRLIRQAIEAMRNGEKVFQFAFDHAESGMVCGGGMSGYGNILGNGNHVYIFGGGHVGQAFAKVAALTGFFVTVVEDRAELKSAFPDINFVECKPEDYETRLQPPSNAYAVICTRGHKTDGEALRFCLARQLPYVGMIGSSKKVSALFKGLRADGFLNERLNGVYTPIGLDIASAAPAEIAIGIMAEILLIKNGGSPSHMRDKIDRANA